VSLMDILYEQLPVLLEEQSGNVKEVAKIQPFSFSNANLGL
jgi:hypothetical protein